MTWVVLPSWNIQQNHGLSYVFERTQAKGRGVIVKKLACLIIALICVGQAQAMLFQNRMDPLLTNAHISSRNSQSQVMKNPIPWDSIMSAPQATMHTNWEPSAYALRINRNNTPWFSLPEPLTGFNLSDFPDPIPTSLSNTTRHTIIPELATVAVLGLGGMAMICLKRNT